MVVVVVPMLARVTVTVKLYEFGSFPVYPSRRVRVTVWVPLPESMVIGSWVTGVRVQVWEPLSATDTVLWGAVGGVRDRS